MIRLISITVLTFLFLIACHPSAVRWYQLLPDTPAEDRKLQYSLCNYQGYSSTLEGALITWSSLTSVLDFAIERIPDCKDIYNGADIYMTGVPSCSGTVPAQAWVPHTLSGIILSATVTFCPNWFTAWHDWRISIANHKL